MKSQKSLLENFTEDQKKRVKNLDDETLLNIYQNKEVALEYATRGVLQSESSRSPDDIAEFMQILARIVLEERGVLRKS